MTSATDRLNCSALLKPVQWPTGTNLAMGMLRGQLVTSVILLIVKAIQADTGATEPEERPLGAPNDDVENLAELNDSWATEVRGVIRIR